MYDELIKRLRRAASYDPRTVTQDCEDAADAIEELQAQINGWIDLERKSLLKSVPRWIPVAERLPDVRDSVLALTGDCDIYVCDYIPSVKQFWTIPGDELHIDDITHWMPLHEPPKELTGTDMRGGIRRDDAGNVIDWGITGPPGEAGKTEEGE